MSVIQPGSVSCLDRGPCASDAPAAGPEWTCSRCAVVSLNAPSHVREKWQRADDGGRLCPSCVADRVAAAARDAAQAELTRDPGATDRAIADRVAAAGHPSIRVREVTTARRELIVEGVIPSPRDLARQRRKAVEAKVEAPKPEVPRPRRPKPPKPKPQLPKPKRADYPAKYPAAAAELRRDSRRGNADIASALGLSSESTVRRVRWALEAAGEIEVYRGNGRAA